MSFLRALLGRVAVSVGVLVVVGLVGVAKPASAQTFAQFEDPTKGTLNGVAFEVTTTIPGYKDAAYLERANTTVSADTKYFNGMTVTFTAPMENVQLRLSYWRGPFGFEEYSFSKPFTVISGLEDVNVSGNSISDANDYINGVIQFTGAINEIEITASPAGNHSSGQKFGLSLGGDSAQACADVTDWDAAATEEGWSCTVDGTEYEYADFHVLISNNENLCDMRDILRDWETSFPTSGRARGVPEFCEQTGQKIHALFDWDNTQNDGFGRDFSLVWLEDIEQIGSRSRRETGDDCGEGIVATVSGRCPNQLKEGARAFRGISASDVAAIANLNTANLDSMRRMFESAYCFNTDIGAWNTSAVRKMDGMFSSGGGGDEMFSSGSSERAASARSSCDTYGVMNFNRNINTKIVNEGEPNQYTAWNTSQVTSMESMFQGATAFDQPIGAWDTSKVASMNYMFSSPSGSDWDECANGCRSQQGEEAPPSPLMSFDQYIGDWNTGSLEEMWAMFKGATAFNQDISTKQVSRDGATYTAWDVSTVYDMDEAFMAATSFDQDLTTWKAVEDPYDFDTGAISWCGQGAENQGRPDSITPGVSARRCVQLSLTPTVGGDRTKVVNKGETVIYEAKFVNNTGTDLTGEKFLFYVPANTAWNQDKSFPGGRNWECNTPCVIWDNLELKAGAGNSEIFVGLDVPADYDSEAPFFTARALLQNADVRARTRVTVAEGSGGTDPDPDPDPDPPEPPGKPAFAATLTAPNYALANTTLSYELSVTNVGSAEATNATVTLTWDQGGPMPTSSSGNCSGTPLTCSWSATIPEGQSYSPSLTVTVPATAQFGEVMDARLSVTHAASSAQGSARAKTTVDARPDLVLVMTSKPRQVIAPGGEVEMTVALKNVGTAPANNVVLTLPTDTATFASATGGGAANGDNVVWPAIASLPASDTATTFTAKLTAGAEVGVIQTQASIAGKTAGGAGVNDTSNLITLRVADEADPVLTAVFDPQTFRPGATVSLNFDISNEGSAELASGFLVVPLPKDTTVATAPTNTGASCTETTCTIPVAALAAGSSTAVSVSLTIDPGSSLTRLGGAGALKPDTQGAFQLQAATAEADLQVTSDIKEPYEISIDPPAGSGCSLTSVSTQQDTGVTGLNGRIVLVRDELLNFTIGGCDPDPLTAIPVAITVQGSALPAGAFAAKVDDAGESGTQIPGATVTGNTIRYTLTDNGSLDLDPDAGELRDPVAVGIILPVLPVPIPYWALALLTGLLGWLGYRRLRLA